MNNENIQENTQEQLPRFLILSDEDACGKKVVPPDIIDSLEIWSSVIESSGKPAVIQRKSDLLFAELSRIRHTVGIYKICLCTASITLQEQIGFDRLFRKTGRCVDFLHCNKHRGRC
jgi:hypothetical protein